MLLFMEELVEFIQIGWFSESNKIFYDKNWGHPRRPIWTSFVLCIESYPAGLSSSVKIKLCRMIKNKLEAIEVDWKFL